MLVAEGLSGYEAEQDEVSYRDAIQGYQLSEVQTRAKRGGWYFLIPPSYPGRRGDVPEITRTINLMELDDGQLAYTVVSDHLHAAGPAQDVYGESMIAQPQNPDTNPSSSHTVNSYGRYPR